MSTNSTLITDRLELRPLRIDDEGLVVRLLQDEDVRCYLGGVVPPERLPGALAGYFDLSDQKAIWLLQLRVSGEPVGVISLTAHKDGEDTELPYQFHPTAWGHGYAAEAGRAVLRHARERMGLRRVIAETQAASVRSQRLLARLGLTELRAVERFGCMQLIYSTDAQSP